MFRTVLFVKFSMITVMTTTDNQFCTSLSDFYFSLMSVDHIKILGNM